MRIHRGKASLCFALGIINAAGIVCARAQADPSGAGEVSSQAGEKAPDSSAEFDRVSKLAEEARQAERVADAISLYQQALRLRPDWDQGWWYLGTLFYSVDRHAEALEDFRHLILNKPKHGPSWAFLGLCELELRDYERALDDLQKARTLGLGDNPMLISVTRYNTAILLNRFGRFESAYKVLQEFVRDRKEDASVIEAFGLSVLQMNYLPSELPPDKYDMVLMAGRAAFKAESGRGEEADKSYQELIARYHEAPNVHYAYGVFLLAGRPNRALEEFRRELETSPSHVPARLQIAFEYFRRNDYKAALPFARAAVELAPNLYKARYALGRDLLEAGETARAIEELEAAVKLAPDDPEVHFGLARAYARVGRKKEATRERTEFLRLDKIQRPEQKGSPASEDAGAKAEGSPPQQP